MKLIEIMLVSSCLWLEHNNCRWLGSIIGVLEVINGNKYINLTNKKSGVNFD